MTVLVALLTPAQVEHLADYGYTTMDAPFDDKRRLMSFGTLDAWTQMTICLAEGYDLTCDGQELTADQARTVKHAIGGKDKLIGVDWSACKPDALYVPPVCVTDESFTYLNSFKDTPRRIRINPLNEIPHPSGKEVAITDKKRTGRIRAVLCGRDPDVEDSPYYVRIVS